MRRCSLIVATTRLSSSSPAWWPWLSDGFQADGIDVHDDERCVDALAAVKLVAEVGQAGDAGAGAGERVVLGDRERSCE